uniref:Leucine Rich repeat-containing domain protein n=1 Tax=Echinostoma caproni TaxID=27848 RepID=A0A183A119_9TREM
LSSDRVRLEFEQLPVYTTHPNKLHAASVECISAHLEPVKVSCPDPDPVTRQESVDSAKRKDHTYFDHLICQPKSHLAHLWIQHNCITSLIPQSLDYPIPFPTLSVSACPRPTLAQLAPRLEHLDASHNRIRTLPGYDHFPASMVHLDLSNNLLTSFGDDESMVPVHSGLGNQSRMIHRPLRTRSAMKNDFGSPNHTRCASATPLASSTSAVSLRSANELRLRQFLHPATDQITLAHLEHLNLRGNRLT